MQIIEYCHTVASMQSLGSGFPQLPPNFLHAPGVGKVPWGLDLSNGDLPLHVVLSLSPILGLGASV